MYEIKIWFLGKLVCWDPADGQVFTETVQNQRKLDEMEKQMIEDAHQEVVTIVQEQLGDIIDNVVHECDSVIIGDIVEEAVNHISISTVS